MGSWSVIFICGLYVVIEAFAAFIFHKFHLMKSEGIRKFIHIATSFLIFPVLYGIDQPMLRYVGKSITAAMAIPIKENPTALAVVTAHSFTPLLSLIK